MNPVPWTGPSGAAEGIRQKVRGCTRCSELELPGTQCARTGTTGDEAAREWKVRAANKEKETAAERHREENKNKSKEQKGEDKKEERRKTGGERARGEREKTGRRMGTWAHGHMEPGPEGPERRGHYGGKGRQEQGEVGREDKEDTSQGKEEKGRPKERTNTDGDSNANARGTTRTRRRRQEKAGGQSRRACTRTSEDEEGG